MSSIRHVWTWVLWQFACSGRFAVEISLIPLLNEYSNNWSSLHDWKCDKPIAIVCFIHPSSGKYKLSQKIYRKNEYRTNLIGGFDIYNNNYQLIFPTVAPINFFPVSVLPVFHIISFFSFNNMTGIWVFKIIWIGNNAKKRMQNNWIELIKL